MSTPETRQDEIDGFVTGLLGLVGIAADPLSSREHILLANLIDASWAQGRDLDLPTLVGQVATPPIRKLGVFELDQFFPPNDRMALAVRLNGLLASSAFAAWSEGAPLDIDGMLHAPGGKPRCRRRVDRSPVRRRTSVRGRHPPRQGRDVDARAVGHHRSACPHLHG